MNKIKKYIISFSTVLILLFTSHIALANNIESINSRAKIHKDGSVTITEHRIFHAEKGTEHYLTFGNLGPSELLDFKVYEKGKELQNIGSWDTHASLEEKAGKYGVNKTSGGIELCFGIGSYGKKDFTIEYTFSNFIRELQDGKQAAYWYFIQPNMNPVSEIEIIVTNDFGFNFKTSGTKIWGFGYKGLTEILDNQLSLVANKGFNTSDYIVMLSIFPEKTFNTTAKSKHTSKSILDLAMKGATSNETTQENPTNNNSNFFSNNAGKNNLILFGLIWLGGAILITPLVYANEKRKKKEEYEKTHKYITNTREGTYYREIPYDGNITDIGEFFTAPLSQYIKVLILKWIQEGYLKDTKMLKGLVFKKEKFALEINQDMNFESDSQAERELWEMIVASSGEDKILSEREFKDYVHKYDNGISWWRAHINKEGRENLEKQNFIKAEDKKLFYFFKTKRYKATEKGQQLIDNIMGFRNYLLDFSLLSEREVGDVKLWDKYMIWASMMGISKEAYKQLSIVNPGIVEKFNYNFDTISSTDSFASSVERSQRIIDNRYDSSSSSGDGGSSYSGGGSGAAGESSGGGTR
ncbi:DUF2207 family protein [Helcococcus kunzii]|uniref:DUF2207 family protein n=1 Tax=Helcococcus kunzii TaxID=40091 RepID=UPI0024AD9D3F|nr:DUF2207 domain-containing protein [Helcococcus kunzii]